MFFAFSLLSLGVAGCSGNEDTTTATDTSNTPTDDAADATSELFDRNFAQVCRDTGFERAAEYTAGAGMHPILPLKSDDGADFSGQIVTLPDGWSAVWPELERTQLVACTVRRSATPVQVCEGYEDDDTGLQWTVQTHDVAYDVTVRNARTAEVLGSQSFSLPAGQCPMFSSYSEGAPQPVPYYPLISDGEFELFVRPFVTGAAVSGPAPSEG